MLQNIHLGQINCTVGDFEGNLQKIEDAYRKAAEAEAEIIVFPELAVTGYPPQDLAYRPAFRAASAQAVDRLCTLTASSNTAIIVGGIDTVDGLAYNAVYFIANGRVIHTQHKCILPNYSVFDEKRVFTEGAELQPIEWNGVRYGILICEDAWQPHTSARLAAQGAERLIIINASPFEQEKLARRHALVKDIATRHRLPVLYVNMCGAQDEIVFDGASFACDSTGNVTCQLPEFEECGGAAIDTHTVLGTLEAVWQAAMLGIKDYVNKNNFPGVLLGLSGGIDSAVVATLAVDALGPARVIGVRLPSPFSSAHSLEDAEALATRLGIKLLTAPISPALQTLNETLPPAFAALSCTDADWLTNPSVGGNVQSRLRGVTLMALSNASGYMLLNTGNKSEVAVGYSTLYGDSCGGYAPLKDIYKTEVYALARWRNAQAPRGSSLNATSVIPENSIHKAPSAELKPGQKDEDQLPPYPLLDAVLKQLVEGQATLSDIIRQGYDQTIVRQIASMLRTSEYKRLQMPPGPKVSSMLFGRDWRYPLTNKFKG